MIHALHAMVLAVVANIAPIAEAQTSVSPAPGAGSCADHRGSGYQALYDARAFAYDYIGEAAMPVEVHALRCLSAEANAVEYLRDLLTRGSLAGQLYALVGLRALDAAEFARQSRTYEKRTDAVQRTGLDVVTKTPVAVIVGAALGRRVRRPLSACAGQRGT